MPDDQVTISVTADIANLTANMAQAEAAVVGHVGAMVDGINQIGPAIDKAAESAAKSGGFFDTFFKSLENGLTSMFTRAFGMLLNEIFGPSKKVTTTESRTSERGGDSQFRAGPGGQVTNVVLNLPPGADIESFRQSESQIAAVLTRANERGGRNL